MKIKLLFLAWSVYLWLGLRSGNPMQLFFAGFFLLLHIGTWCHQRELRGRKAAVQVQSGNTKSTGK